MHLKRAFNPGFFLNDQLALNLYPLPSRDWNVASAGGPHLDWRVPANAKKIYAYLGKAGGQVGNFGSNPLWKIADGPFVLSSFSPVTASWTVKANPELRRHPEAVPRLGPGRHVHRDHADAERDADRQPRRRTGRLLPARRRLQPEEPGLQRVRSCPTSAGPG